MGSTCRVLRGASSRLLIRWGAGGVASDAWAVGSPIVASPSGTPIVGAQPMQLPSPTGPGSTMGPSSKERSSGGGTTAGPLSNVGATVVLRGTVRLGGEGALDVDTLTP